MNTSTALREAGRDKILLIRQDGFIEVTRTGKQTEIIHYANFRRAEPNTAVYIPHNTSHDRTYWYSIYEKRTAGHASHDWHSTRRRDAPFNTDLPVPGCLYHIVFEVRLDGKAHPWSFSESSKVATSANSIIASSRALRVEWKDKQNVSRFRYIRNVQSATEAELRCQSHPDMSLTCQSGMAMIHHLFGIKIPKNSGLKMAYGNAIALYAHHVMPRNLYHSATTKHICASYATSGYLQG
jgi:hypothetical protein